MHRHTGPRRWLLRVVSSTMVLAACALATRAAASAPATVDGSETQAMSCDDATLSGAYGFEGSGLLFVDSNRQPAAMLGVVTLDGAGHGTGQIQLNLGVGFLTTSLGGLVYTVNPDCSGYVSFMGFGAGFVIQGGGEELDLREADGIGAVAGVARPLADSCGDAVLSGSYALSTQGWLITSAGSDSLQFVEASASGTQRFDGAGGTERSLLESSVDGRPVPEAPEMGSYRVDADCSGSERLGPAGGEQEAASLVVVAGGREVWSLDTAPSAAVIGRLEPSATPSSVQSPD